MSSKLTRLSALPFTVLSVLAVGSAASGNPNELFKLTPDDGSAYQYFGVSVAIDGDLTVVGAPNFPDYYLGSSSAYVFDVSTGQQLRKLLPGSGTFDAGFGSSVAIDGDLIAVGASTDDDLGEHSGSVLIFEVSTGVQQFKLLASDGGQWGYFGSAVSISGDRLLVGAPHQGSTGAYTGAAYVFDATTGAQLHKLAASDGADGDKFGISVSISGNLAVVGASTDDDNGFNSGSAYLFDVTTGQQLQKLVPADGVRIGLFGISVSLDGDHLVVGAAADNDNGNRSGSAYVYDVTSGAQLHKLLAEDGATFHNFGASVSIDGSRIVVGAAQNRSTYLFDLDTGTQIQQITPADVGPQEVFGNPVAIGGDRIVIGRPHDDENGIYSGSAYVFDSLLEPGTGYCTGDPGSGTPCPCSNDNDGSQPGAGCANGVYASGALLTGSGIARVTADSLVLSTTGLEPSNSGLYFQADNDLSPGVPWGDGLRCAGGQLKRLGVRMSDATGNSDTSAFPLPISVKAGNVQPGDTKYYQCWYRTVVNPPCGTGVNDFNASNGYSITWLP